MSGEMQKNEDGDAPREEQVHMSSSGEPNEPQEVHEQHLSNIGQDQQEAIPSDAKESTEGVGDSVVTPRVDDHVTQDQTAMPLEDHDDYFNFREPLKQSSSGYLASLSSSQKSSPLHSTSASTTSLQSSHASYEHGDSHIAPTTPRFVNHDAQRSSGSLQSVAHSATSSRSSQATSNLFHERPSYPDQSHAALHHQPSTLPYAFMKSRASDYGHSQPVSVSPSSSIGRVTASSVSRSADQTPLQSPSLFQVPNRAPSQGSGQISPALLHPAQVHIPKETYKLIKDFDTTTGNKIMNNYEVLEKLGMGSHGAVKRARNLVTDEQVAIKIVRRYGKKGRLGKQESPEDKVKKEVAVLKKARHPHVVSLLEVIDDPEFGKVYIVLEYVKKGEIIWRTETMKEIADFEMHRYERECAKTVDPEIEAEMMARLNAKLLTQEAAQKRAVRHAREDRKFQPSLDFHAESGGLTTGDDQLELRRYGTADHPDFPGHVEPQAEHVEGEWSNEIGGYEDDTDTERRRVRQLRRRRSMNKKSEMYESTFATQRAIEPVSKPSPDLQNLSSSLTGSQYGPYDHEGLAQGSSVVDFRDILSAASNQPQWTSEEDDFRYVPCLTMSQAREVFRDTVLGLEYLHFQGIIHRDIKPANLLWTSDYRVKISDFGVSYIGRPIREKDDEQDEPPSGLDEEFELAKTVGTPAFYAPELCDPDLFNTEKTPVRPQITGQIDVWALGVTLYCMIFGRLPFSGENQFEMFERIAWEDPFISSMRLRGVEEDGKMPMNSNKRLPYHVEYEEVDDLLKDLIRRLLHKDPTRRITLKEVKHHPWVVKGLKDPAAWIENTDASLQSKGKKIEVSTNDIITAVAPLNLVDRIKHQFSTGIKRLSSVVGRGRDSRRRAESVAKDPNASGGSVSSRASTLDREARRPSLRGDEQIYTALRASRDTGDHPLSHSLMASPVAEKLEQPFFVHPIPHVDYPSATASSSPSAYYRPAPVDRTDSTTESILTIKPSTGTETVRASTPPTIAEDPDGRDSAASSSTGLSNILGLASRRLVTSMQRSRERLHSSRDNSNASSRSSSYEQMASSFEEAHAYPSVAISPAMAMGHVDHPLLDPNDALAPHHHYPAPRHLNESSPGAYDRAETQNIRRMILEHEQAPEPISRPQSRDAVAYAGECPPSPDDIVIPLGTQDSHEHHDQPAALDMVSSDDQFVLSESFSNPSIPSTSTSTSHDPHSSMLATAETLKPEKYNEERRKSLGVGSAYSIQGSNPEDDEAGYNGDGDGDGDDSDEDEGLMMGGRQR